MQKSEVNYYAKCFANLIVQRFLDIHTICDEDPTPTKFKMQDLRSLRLSDLFTGCIKHGPTLNNW